MTCILVFSLAQTSSANMEPPPDHPDVLASDLTFESRSHRVFQLTTSQTLSPKRTPSRFSEGTVKQDGLGLGAVVVE